MVKPSAIVRRRHGVGAQVEVQPVLAGLPLSNAQHIDRRPRAVERGDADDPFVVLIHHVPSQDIPSELCEQPGVHGVDCDNGDAARHARHPPSEDRRGTEPAGGRRGD